jgi:hypothetical protein
MAFCSSFKEARRFFAASVISVSGDAETFKAVSRATKANEQIGSLMRFSR